jgi:hypothetical protein
MGDWLTSRGGADKYGSHQEFPMINLTNMAFAAALLAAAGGSAYAQDLQPQGGTLQVPQVSAVPTPKMEPKPSGGSNTESTHFIKPPGYDQDPWNYPYGKGSGPRPN